MAVTGKLAVSLNLRETGTADSGLQNAINEISSAFPTWNITSGTGANQADKVFADTRTLAASGTEDLDFSGALVNLLGTVVIAKIKAIYVYAAVANTNNVQISQTATTGVPIFLADGDGLSIRPGWLFLLAAGQGATGSITVTPTTDDTLTVTNSGAGTGVDYTIIVIGTSA